MAYTGAQTSGNNDEQNGIAGKVSAFGRSTTLGKSALKRKIGMSKGSGGKLGKASTTSESLSKLRGKGAIG